MSWFTPKLEPGERLILRQPKAPGRLGLILGLLLALLSWLGSYLFIDWISPNGVEPHGYILSLFLPAQVLGQIVSARKWRVALTDRRLIIRRSIFRGAPREILLSEIEDIRMNIPAGYGVAQTADQEIKLPMEQTDLPKLKQALASANKAI